MRSPTGPPTNGARRHGAEKDEQLQLRAPHRDVESCQSDRTCSNWSGSPGRSTSRRSARAARRSRATPGRRLRVMRRSGRAASGGGDDPALVPAADAPEHRDRDQRASENQAMLRWPWGSTMNAASNGPSAEPALPPTWKNDCAKPCCPPEPCGRCATIPGEIPTSRCRPAPRPASSSAEGASEREQQQTGQRKPMPAASEYGRGAGPCSADHGLQQRRRELIGQRDEADLREVELKRVLQHRIDRGQQRLHHVVQQMADAEGPEDSKGGLSRGQAFG